MQRKRHVETVLSNRLSAVFDGQWIYLNVWVDGAVIHIGPEEAVALRDYLTRLTTRHDA